MESSCVKPAFKINNIPIVFASNQEYAPYLSVAFASVKANANPAYNYDIIVLITDMDAMHQNLLKDNMRAANVSLRFLNISEDLIRADEYEVSQVSGFLNPLTFGCFSHEFKGLA